MLSNSCFLFDSGSLTSFASMVLLIFCNFLYMQSSLWISHYTECPLVTHELPKSCPRAGPELDPRYFNHPRDFVGPRDSDYPMVGNHPCHSYHPKKAGHSRDSDQFWDGNPSMETCVNLEYIIHHLHELSFHCSKANWNSRADRWTGRRTGCTRCFLQG